MKNYVRKIAHNFIVYFKACLNSCRIKCKFSQISHVYLSRLVRLVCLCAPVL